MELILQDDLQHQILPVEAIADVFKEVSWKQCGLYSNPVFDIASPMLKTNLLAVKEKPQNNLSPLQKGRAAIDAPLGLDIRMETGTGKTYVYTRAVFELHHRYGVNKFIIVVPTLPIKAGAQNFLTETYVSQHFADILGYDAAIDLCVVTPMKTKKGKRFFPSSVRKFVGGNSGQKDKIQVLLVNQGLLSGTAKVLSRNDYDTGILEYFRPYDALRSTHPFVIIDEPHKFDKGNTTYKTILEELCPQCIIRFGATFPKKVQGRGKNKTEVDDYANLLFDLTAKDAFEQNLIKGVAKEHLEIENARDEKIKVLSTVKGKSVTLKHTTDKTSATKELAVGDSLGLLSTDLSGLTVTAISKDGIVLSNAQKKSVGMEFAVDAYSESYQEHMIRLALKRHFETERENFDRPIRIKTLALFFIDSITSFRGDENGDGAWLRDMFDRVLEGQINSELTKNNSIEYAEYLRATKSDLAASRAGYFAQDANESDDAVAKEVEDILHNKKELLSFKTKENRWNTRRFLFSKWTLREGWDNPNVFTIAKLRSSGSEISKLQEVGRGLRLPVDEYGNRISNEVFMLNYIIDFTEKNFAADLVAEVNSQRQTYDGTISQAQLQEVAKKRGMKEMALLMELWQKGYITDSNRTINSSRLFEFFAEYPEFNVITKIKDRNAKKQPKQIKIRPDVYEELKRLWEEMNRKYVIFFDKEIDSLVKEALPVILKDNVFASQIIVSQREKVTIKDNEAVVSTGTGEQFTMQGKHISYRDFLRRANRATSIPVTLLHNAIVEYSKTVVFKADFINESSLSRFVEKFNEWRAANLQGRFNYKRANYSTEATALTNEDGTLKSEITQGLVGAHLENGTTSGKYLYDVIAYDSPLERDNIISDIEEVVVYGKIPRRSISIPTVADSSYSPDFMYVVRKKNGEKELNIVIETKDVEDGTNLRDNEAVKISCAERFFEQLTVDGYTVHFHKQLNHKKMKTIIDEIMAQ